MPLPVNLDEPAPFVEQMNAALARARALLGGTDAMRAAREAFLPRFPGEHADTYDWRLKVAVLNNFFEAMAGQMVGMMFKKPVVFDKPSQIDKATLANIDKRGRDINAFAGELCKALLTKGRPHILVDHPKKPEGALTRADDLRLGLRPYWVMLEPECVVSAFADTDNGEERLRQFRWRESGSSLDGYAITTVERIRVMQRTETGAIEFEVWERRGPGAEWALKDEGQIFAAAGKDLGEVPVVTLYSDRQAFMVAKPTLDDIAHKNIEHWQSSADQRHILTVSRFPILYQVGVKEPAALVGPYSMFWTQTPKTEAEIGYAEAQGSGIEQGWKDLDRIVAEAEAMGVRIITSDAAKTESGEQIDYAKEGSPLQKLAVELERGLNQALALTARYQGLADEQAGHVKVHKDFGLSTDDVKAIEQLLKLREMGDLSQPTVWREIAERGLFKTPFNPKTEAGLIEDEKARNIETQLSMGLGGGGEETDDEADEDKTDDDAPAPPKAR